MSQRGVSALSSLAAMLGALVFLVLRGQVNNVYAQVGLVTLIGLAAKNGILIVDLANQRMERGMAAEIGRAHV